MRLRPVVGAAVTAATAPAYPRRSAEVLRRANRVLCRAGAVALASVALLFAGCRTAGSIMEMDPPLADFVCDQDTETQKEPLDIPGTYEGSLCGQGSTAWGVVEVTESSVVEVALDGSGGAALDASAHVVDPTGLVVAEVPAGGGFAAVYVSLGTWRIAVVSGPTATASEGFELTLQAPAEE